MDSHRWLLLPRSFVRRSETKTQSGRETDQARFSTRRVRQDSTRDCRQESAGRCRLACAAVLWTTSVRTLTRMYFRGLGTATPPSRYTKAECLDAFQPSEWLARLDTRSHLIARTVLQRDNGIEARRLALDTLDQVFTIDPGTLDLRFLANAPALATQAATRALESAGLDASEIGAVVVSTCTGYVCPGLSGYVVERLGLRGDVQAYDLVGQGCAAALPNLQLGRSLLASGAVEHVLSVCVEVSSAAMYLDNDPGVLI